MVTLWAIAEHYIFIIWFLSSVFFFPRLISAVQIGCLPYFYTWCVSSENWECRSETYCTRAARGSLL